MQAKYILRLFIVLTAWSAFYALSLHKSIYPLGSQEGHFWYLGMCIGLYLALPIMRMIAQQKHLLSYFCWVWFLVEAYQFVGEITHLPFPIDFGDVLFVDYVGYCLFAYYIKSWSLSKVQEWCIYAIGLLSLAITVVMGLITQNSDTAYYDYMSPNVICFSIALFFFFVRHSLNVNRTIASLIQRISSYTLGIYMVHMWILIQIIFRIHRFIENPLVLSVACVVTTFVVGACITFVLKKIPYIGRWIV